MKWLALILMVTCGIASASQDRKPKEEMVVTDEWGTTDKRDHFVGSLIAGGLSRGFLTTNKLAAGGLCMVPGVVKEAYDSRRGGPGNWSWKDMAANGLGCGLGVLGTDAVLQKNGKGYTLWMDWRF